MNLDERRGVAPRPTADKDNSAKGILAHALRPAAPISRLVSAACSLPDLT